MMITANQDFLHDKVRYTAGESYDVPDHLAGYFVGVGWADADGLETGLAPPSVTLDVHNASHANETGDV